MVRFPLPASTLRTAYCVCLSTDACQLRSIRSASSSSTIAIKPCVRGISTVTMKLLVLRQGVAIAITGDHDNASIQHGEQSKLRCIGLRIILKRDGDNLRGAHANTPIA